MYANASKSNGLASCVHVGSCLHSCMYVSILPHLQAKQSGGFGYGLLHDRSDYLSAHPAILYFPSFNISREPAFICMNMCSLGVHTYACMRRFVAIAFLPISRSMQVRDSHRVFMHVVLQVCMLSCVCVRTCKHGFAAGQQR